MTVREDAAILLAANQPEKLATDYAAEIHEGLTRRDARAAVRRFRRANLTPRVRILRRASRGLGVRV